MKTPTQIAAEAANMIVHVYKDYPGTFSEQTLVLEDLVLTAIQHATEEGAKELAAANERTRKAIAIGAHDWEGLRAQLAARDGVIAQMQSDITEARNFIAKCVTKSPIFDAWANRIDRVKMMLNTALERSPATYADKLKEAEAELASLRGLLAVAVCPDPNCDGKGSSWHVEMSSQSGEAEQVQHQCQWCDERARLATERKEDKQS